MNVKNYLRLILIHLAVAQALNTEQKICAVNMEYYKPGCQEKYFPLSLAEDDMVPLDTCMKPKTEAYLDPAKRDEIFNKLPKKYIHYETIQVSGHPDFEFNTRYTFRDYWNQQPHYDNQFGNHL